MKDDKVLVPPPRPLPEVAETFDDALSRRINADPEGVERGLAQLVLTIVELLRQLMERQALHRVEAGGLTNEEIERLGRTLMLLEQRMEELKEEFGLEDRDLNLNLGPLGNLL
jgi:hypothetical protein